MEHPNQGAVRLVKPYINVLISMGETLPAKADFIGQLFVKTGKTKPGLYVATGTATPGWKAVSHEA